MSVHLRSLRILAGKRALVSQVSLHILPGQITVLVGASGSGKTLTARSLLGLVHGIEPGIVAADLEIQDGVLGRGCRVVCVRSAQSGNSSPKSLVSLSSVAPLQ